MKIARWLIALGFAGALVAGLLLRPGEPKATYADDKADSKQADAARHFETKIAPLLARHCLECHDSAAKKGGLDLSRRDAAGKGGESGEAIVPGKSDESLLWQYVEIDEMPPNRQPLSAEEKRQLREWIDGGAVWPVVTIDPPAYAPERLVESIWLQRLTVPEYIETVRSTLGVDVEQDARRLLPPDLRADGFTNTAYSLSVDLEHVEAYAELARIVAGRIDAEAFAAQFTKCRDLDKACMRELIAAMGKRLLRGPLQEREIEAYLGVAAAVEKERGTFAEAVGYLVEAMLQSPRFIYRVERQRGDGPVHRPSDYELASRLSYILWGAPPDEELMRAADAGELSDRGHVEAQVQRMLKDPRAVKRSTRFIHEWMDLGRLASLRPNADRFPGWDAQLAADMRDETLTFFQEIAWEQNRPLSDLMNAQVTYATPRLADHYGLTRDQIVDSPSHDEGPSRVTEGLQALYTFEEGRGDRVRDRSGAGDALDLKIEKPSAVRWSDNGLTVNSSTLITTDGPPKRLFEKIRESNAVTLEAWVTPANTSQSGPARILTLSNGIGARNFTLGQDGDKFDVRFRTTKTSGNGQPSLSSPDRSVQTRLTHVVYTRDNRGKATLYIDGQERGARDVGGDLANWDAGFRLALANETSKDRPWQGTLHLVAVYSRALSPDEVQRNRAAGKAESRQLASIPERVSGGLQALYTFEEGSGDRVRDRSGAGDALDLKIEKPSAVRWGSEGLTVNSSTLIASDGAPARLIDALREANALTLEAWVTPANTSQAGPARILTLSKGTGARNFTLGQDGDKYDVRLRASTTDANGNPSLAGPGGSVRTQRTHVVYTRETDGRAKLYVDGRQVATRDVRRDFSNWDGSFRLALANETSKDRPWQGTLHLAAIYNRALSADEVQRNLAAGAQDGGPSTLQALYTFEEGEGETVRDTSGAGEPLDLKIDEPGAVEWSDAGLVVNKPTLIAAAKPPKRLLDAVRKSQAITLEAWVTPADTRQSGPARILTFSGGTLQRNFTLGQDADKYEVRFRGKTTNESGLPGVNSASGSVATRLTHLVYTRDTSGKARLYVNGEEQGTRDVVGDLSNWDGNFQLALANETSKDRPWRGTYHRVAIYSRALGPDEIRSRGGALSRYDLASVPSRGGLLTQGSLLTIGGDHASMVTRGLFVLHDLLYSRVGNPPPCVDTTPVPTKPGLTQRAVAMQRIADSSCGGCHSKFEPLAFGLEKFDGVGAWHEKDEHGNELRDDGEILFPGDEQPVSYRNSAECMDLLAGSERVRMGITRKLTQFAIGRPLVAADQPIVEKIHKTAWKNGGTYASLITAIVMSDLVQTTRTETAESHAGR